MNKSHVITAVKLLLVVALMAYVFTKVTWRDTLVRLTEIEGTTPTREVLATGAVQGDWDTPSTEPVRFRRNMADGELGPEELIDRAASLQPVPGGATRLDFEYGFLTYWRHLDVMWFLLGALCYVTTVILAGARWWWLLRCNGIDVSLLRAQRLTWIGVFFGNVVPGATGGDLVKALYIMKDSPGQRVQSLVSVIVDRIMGLASLALLCGIAVLFMFDEFATIAILVWGVIAGVGMLGIVAFSKRVRRAIRLKELLDKLPFSATLKRVDESVHYYRGHKRGLLFWLVFGMVNHVVSVASVLFMGIALGVGLDGAAYLVVVPVANIVAAVPMGPNGWGLGEAAYGELFARYGTAVTETLRRTQGVSLSVLYRLHITIVSLFGGILVLLEKDRVTRSDVEEELATEAAEDAHREDPREETSSPTGRG